MIDSLFTRGSIGPLESLLAFAGARHRVIAGNIAHVDTAGYRTLDLPADGFGRALARAFEGRISGVLAPPRAVESADAGMLKPGGNNVDLDLEMAKMVRNQSLHVAASALLAQQFAMLRTAITERVA
jgi:flagellar basal body rod protein FlgB